MGVSATEALWAVAPRADHTLSDTPCRTRLDVARAIHAKHKAPAKAVASTPKVAAEVCAYMPRAGMSQAKSVVTGIARVRTAADQSRCTDARAPPRRKAQAMLAKNAA